MDQRSSEIAHQAIDNGTSASDNAPSAAIKEIRSQIEETRSDISETIDAIHGRLSPARLVTDATDSIKDATIGRVKNLANTSRERLRESDASVAADSAIDFIMANPVPTALVGAAATAVGVAAWMRSRHRRLLRPNNAVAASPQRSSRRGRKRRFLLGTCAGVACWGAWRAQHR